MNFPSQLNRLRAEWAPSVPRELLAGAVATFALIPEVIAFSFVAGVDPAVGLYASFIISIVIAVFGARPAMVSAAAGSVALVAAPLVASHGLQYLLAAGLLAGAMQIVFGLLKMGMLVRFVSSSVRTGFLNALAVLIFSAQLPHLRGANAATWAMLALGLLLIYALPWLGQRLQVKALVAIPSPLICVLVLTVLSSALGLPLKTVADLGHLPDSLPLFALPEVPASLQTLRIIALPALAIAMVGLLESVLTAAVVDDMTGTPSNKNRECTGLGLANMTASVPTKVQDRWPRSSLGRRMTRSMRMILPKVRSRITPKMPYRCVTNGCKPPCCLWLIMRCRCRKCPSPRRWRR